MPISGIGRLLCVVAGALLLCVAPAEAHVSLRSTSPAANSTLERAPRELRLAFSGSVEPGLARLALSGPQGSVALGTPRRGSGSDSVLIAPITGDLVPGGYTVQWQIAGPDGHPMRGEFAFVIAPGASGVPEEPGADASPDTAAAPAPGPQPPPDPSGEAGSAFDAGSPLYAAVRWLTFAGLLAGIGSVAFALLLLPRLRRRAATVPPRALERARARAASVGLVAAAVLVAALALRLLAQSVALHGPAGALAPEPTRIMLTRTAWGWGWILQAAATTVLIAGLWAARRGAAAGWALAGLATLALAVTPALSGHAAAGSTLGVIADGIHVLAAGGWMGTLLLMLFAGLPVLLREGEGGTRAAAALVGAFAPIAVGFVVVLTLTGVYSAWLHLPDLDALVSSDYGRTLLVKLGAVAVVLALGAVNNRRGPAALERGDPDHLRRSATAELAFGAVVLAVTAVLVATPPPVDEAPSESGSPAAQERPQ